MFKGSSIRLSYSHPLTKTVVAQGAGNQGETATNSTMQLGLKYTPLSYWFVVPILPITCSQIYKKYGIQIGVIVLVMMIGILIP